VSEPEDRGSAEEALERAEGLLERLERTRARLEATDDPEAAIDVLTELAEIAKQIEREIAEAKRRADAGEDDAQA
jgi:flagellar hook-associated protein FlgK